MLNNKQLTEMRTNNYFIPSLKMQQLEIFMDMQSRHSNIQSAVAFDPLLHVSTFD